MNNTDLSRLQVIDLSEAFAVTNAQLSPLLSILLATRKTKASDVTVSRRVKTFSQTPSGKKGEGFKPASYEKTVFTYKSNVCEIFNKNVSISNTTIAVAGNGKLLMAQEIEDRIVEIKKDLENSIINGTKAEGDPRAMGGILEGKNITDLAAAPLTVEHLEAELVKLHNAGCIKDVYLLVNPTDKSKLDKVILEKERYQVNIGTGQVVAGVSVQKYWSSLGFQVNILVTPNVTAGKLVFVDLGHMELPVLRDLQATDLAVTGDSQEKMIVAEVTNLVADTAVVGVSNFI